MIGPWPDIQVESTLSQVSPIAYVRGFTEVVHQLPRPPSQIIERELHEALAEVRAEVDGDDNSLIVRLFPGVGDESLV